MNPKLEQYEAGIEENIKPEDKDAYDRIVTAGMKIVASDEFHDKMVEALKGEGNLPEKIADGMARLISMMHVSAQGTMPVHVTIAASFTLMVKALDFAERALGEEITDDVIADTAMATISAVGPILGVTKEKLAEAMQGQQDPSGQPAEQPPAAPAAPQPTGLMSGT